MGRRRRTLYCSFCGKRQQEVLSLIGSSCLQAFICNECVEVMVQRMATAGIKPFRDMGGAKVLPFARTQTDGAADPKVFT